MSTKRTPPPPLGGLIAILRGITPDEVGAIGDVLVTAGFHAIEVPLNSPEPLESIRRLASRLGEAVLVGAGTVLHENEVEAVAAAGGRLIVSPNMDPAVIIRAKALGLVSAPGVLTPSEAFRALDAGADMLKIFPAEMAPPSVIKAMLAVLPKGCLLAPVGGITPASIAAYHAAGAGAFGIGSALYAPGRTAEQVAAAARGFAAAWRECTYTIA